MSVQPVQISMDPDLLRRIDSDPEVRKGGRSAFIRAAVRKYLEDKRNRQIDEALERAYRGQADALLEEAEPLVEAQAWPKD